MSGIPAIGYNHFLLENNPLDIFRSIFSGKPIIENIANFCYTPKRKRIHKRQIYNNVARANSVAMNINSINNGLLSGSTFSSINGFCNPNGNCYECDSDGNCRNTSTGKYYSKTEMDNMYVELLGVKPYILDKSSPNTFFRVGEIGNTATTGSVIEGFNSNIKRNTGENERYLNILYVYNKSMAHVINVGLGILCLLIVILYLHRI